MEGSDTDVAYPDIYKRAEDFDTDTDVAYPDIYKREEDSDTDVAYPDIYKSKWWSGTRMDVKEARVLNLLFLNSLFYWG